MSQDKLKELLNYSTSLSSSSNAASSSGTSHNLDPSILDAIMGPDDAQLMLSTMTALKAPTTTEEESEIAFENLEALVEQIDNAKNLENCQLWTPLLSLLLDSRATYRASAASVVATALQNNPTSQQDFLKYGDAGLSRLLELWSSDEEVAVRRKALFAVTCALRNCSAALQRFEVLGGWAQVSAFLDGVGDLNMMRRIVFFLGTLYASNGEDGFEGVSRAAKTGFPPKLVTLLSRPQVMQDEDLAEKVLYTLAQSLKYDSDVLNRELKDKLRTLSNTVKEKYGEEFYEGRELDGLL